MGRGVAAALVALPDGPGGQRRAGQVVGQCGLARPGRAEQGHGPAPPEVAGDGVEAGAGRGADSEEIDADTGRFEPLDCVVESVTGHEVGFGEHDHRGGAALPDQRDVAFDAPGCDPTVGGDEHEHGVDVGGQRLGLRAEAGGAADEGRPPGQRSDHDGLADQHPVSNGHGRPGRDGCPAGAARAEHGAGTEIDSGHPGGVSRAKELDGRGQGGGPGVVPAEVGERYERKGGSGSRQCGLLGTRRPRGPRSSDGARTGGRRENRTRTRSDPVVDRACHTAPPPLCLAACVCFHGRNGRWVAQTNFWRPANSAVFSRNAARSPSTAGHRCR